MHLRYPVTTVIGLGVLLLASDAGHGVSCFSTINRKPRKTFTTTSLPVATIDAGEVFGGSLCTIDGSAEEKRLDACLDDYDCEGKTFRESASTAVERIRDSGLVWSAVGAFSLLSAALRARAPGAWLKPLNHIFSWYLTRLELAPLVTKCVTGGIISLIGDYGAQWFEHRSSRSRERTANPALSLRAGGGSPAEQSGRLSMHGSYDTRRGVARFLECLLVSSPLMHYGYDFFEAIFPVAGSVAALTHVLLDCVFLDGIFVGTTILATGLLEGRPLRGHVLPNLRRVYLPTLKASAMTSGALFPLQFLSFRFLPVQLRVLSVNAMDLIWTAVVSFVSHGGDAEGGASSLQSS